MAAKRNMFISVAVRIVVCAAALAIGVGVFVALFRTAPKPAASDRADEIPRVLVMEARAVPVRREFEGFGTAQAVSRADVPSRVTATVAERPAEIRAGREVAQGQLLVQLDASDFQRQWEIAEQNIRDVDAQLNRLDVEERSWSQRVELAGEAVELARSEFDRVSRAFANDAARQREVDAARQALLATQREEVATREELEKIAPRRASLRALREREQASLRLARLNVERSTITAPISGVLQSVDVEVGESVQAGERVARIVSLERIEVPLLLPAAARPHVAIGDAVSLSAGGARSFTWSAHVRRISPEDDEVTRTMRVFVEVTQSPEAANVLAPGRFVQGVVTSGQETARFVVPRRSIRNDRIRLVKDGTIQTREVTTDFQLRADLPNLGLADTQWAALRDELPVGALVVVDASRTLAEGQRVEPVVAESEPVLSRES